jgi:small conductance mechanosensitive channel
VPVRPLTRPTGRLRLQLQPIDEVVPIHLLAETANQVTIDTIGDPDVWLKVGGAVLLVVVTVVIGAVTRRVLDPRLARLRTPSFGAVFSRLIQTAIVIVGIFAALTMVFPSVNAATALGSLGVLSIAAGFAFQDILSNLLAGILLIFRQPFVTGDQIQVADVRGTVEGITIRETRIRTFQGHLVVVPNADVYTSNIDVQTNKPQVRTDLEMGIDYDADVREARELALEVLAEVPGVFSEPAPQVELVGFGASSMDFVVRYWTSSRQADIRGARDRVIEAIKLRFDEAGIEFPFQVVTLDADDSFARAMHGTRTG